MILYVNDRNEVKDVNNTSDESLSPLFVFDNNNPFMGWSIAKICCHKVKVVNGVVTEYIPYVDSRLIEHIDKLGKSDESTVIDITDTQMALTEIFEKALSSEADITDIQLALAELYTMLQEVKNNG